MNIHFKLRQQGRSLPIIVLNIYDGRLKGRKFMHSTSVRIARADWDGKKGRTKIILAKAAEYTKINEKLDNLEKALIDFRGTKLFTQTLTRNELKFFLKQCNAASQTSENQVTVASTLAATSTPEIKNSVPDINSTQLGNNFEHSGIFSIWRKIVEETKTRKGLPIAKSTKSDKLQTVDIVEKFSVQEKVLLTLENIDMTFYNAFDNYLQRHEFKDNTRGKHFKNIKAFMREAADRDLEVNLSYQKKRFKVLQTEPDKIYLDDNDLKKILSVKLDPPLAQLRDIFIMACFVGARHSDWPQINPSNLLCAGRKYLLRIKQQKTKETIHVPVHIVVQDILKKYKNNLPKVTSNSKFNEALKEIGEAADLGTTTVDNQIVLKWTQISTHTARRSFATNAYLSGSMEVHQIMKCTGHKTEKSFLRYIRLNGKDYAIQAAKSKFFNDKSYSSLIAA